MAATVHIIDYGAGNLFSVRHAFESTGVEVSLVREPSELDRAAHLVLPGVGAFGAGMDGLRRAGLVEGIRAHAANGRPLLGICLGMHLMLEVGRERGDHEGLGIFPGVVDLIPGGVTIPHMGWHRIELERESHVLSTAFDAYFAHSYCVSADHPDMVASVTHGTKLAVALERDNVFALQFHPEKSSRAGVACLGRFLES